MPRSYRINPYSVSSAFPEHAINTLQMQRTLASADVVEVSVALAEALVLEREGAALKWRGASGERPSTETLVVELEPDTPGADAEPAEAAAETLVTMWDDEKAASNKRHIKFLSESLDASEVHDLQVLCSSLERQAADKGRLGKAEDTAVPVEEVGCSAGEKEKEVSTVG